ncbi:F-box protein [Aspergillus stella-maris]|uniref:F-box protein n=1 Tax=Aspergillus stella-maris TaxID=1810926 RepID=UPI003CCE3C24
MGASCSTSRECTRNDQLQKLPDELILALIRDLDRASLVRLCRVSRRLREIGSSALYRRTQVGLQPWEMPAANFERSPRLAQYVRDLIIHYDRILPGEPPYAETLTPVLADMRDLSSLTIKGAGSDGCPPHTNQRKWYWNRFPATESDKARQVLESAKFHHLFLKSTFLPILTNLRVCKLRFSDRGWWDLSSRDSIFLHPRLKRLFIYGAAMKDFCCYSEDRRSSTSLEELYLSECDMSPATLHKVLSLPKALQQFTLTGGIYQTHYQATGERQLYLDAVKQQAHSLKMLKLEFPWDASYATPNGGLNFQAFPVLEELTTTTELITGNLIDLEPPPPPPVTNNPLPHSLKIIRLRYAMAYWEAEWERSWESAIANWVNTGALPSLSTVVFYRDLYGMIRSPLRGTTTADVTLLRRDLELGYQFPIDCISCERNGPMRTYRGWQS